MSLPAPRYDIALPVRIVLNGSNEDVRGTSENISESGVLIRAERLVPLRSQLHVEFPIFAATAEVIWTRDVDGDASALLGMKFLTLGSEDRKMLLRILAGPASPERARLSNAS